MISKAARSKSYAKAYEAEITDKDLGKIKNPSRRKACEDSLARFGVTYCADLLRHEPSAKMIDRFIVKLQGCITKGGQFVVEFPRGTGKTTWVKIGLVWALVYGYRRFPVAFAANAKLAKAIVKDVWTIFARSKVLAEDFPAVCVPIRKIGGVVQRCPAQTYHGESTGIELKSDHLVLASLRNEKGEARDIGCGARLLAFGLGGGFKGISEMGERPDLLFFDDPQTRKDAGSATSVARLEEKIHGDALGLAGQVVDIAALCAITPIMQGDLATKLTNKADHPEWSVAIVPLVEKWGRAKDLIPGFVEVYREDAAADDFARTRSRQYYLDHQEEFSDIDVLDPLNFAKGEVDARHHVLVLVARSGEATFGAEYQLQVADKTSGVQLKPEEIATQVNGYPEFALPLGITDAVAFCDVNVQAASGLRWTILGVGPNRVAAVLAYGRYPKQGRLYEEGASDLEKQKKLTEGIFAAYNAVLTAPLHRAGDNKKVCVRGMMIDGGYEQSVVSRCCALMKSRYRSPFPVAWARGYGWRNFPSERKNARKGDHMHAGYSPRDGEFITIQADYWREVAQAAWAAQPLQAGSVSLFGNDPRKHYASGYTLEICNEHLVRKYIHPSGKMAWEWMKAGANHWGDTLSGAFACASWLRCYDAVSVHVSDATPAIIAQSLEKPKPKVFRPLHFAKRKKIV